MVSMLEKEGLRKRDYNGLAIYELAKTDRVRGVTATLSDSEKLHYVDPTVCIDRTENSWKYGAECQIVVWSIRKPEIRNRVEGPQPYHRIEICLPIQEAVRLFESALRKLWLLE